MLYMFDTDAVFFNIFNLCLVESKDVETADMKGQVYTFLNSDFVPVSTHNNFL